MLPSADLQLATAFSRWDGGISRSLVNAHNLTYTSPKATGQQRYLAPVGSFCDVTGSWKNDESCGRSYFWSSLQFQLFPYISFSATPSLLSCAEHLESAFNSHLGLWREFFGGILAPPRNWMWVLLVGVILGMEHAALLILLMHSRVEFVMSNVPTIARSLPTSSPWPARALGIFWGRLAMPNPELCLCTQRCDILLPRHAAEYFNLVPVLLSAARGLHLDSTSLWLHKGTVKMERPQFLCWTGKHYGEG